MNTQPSTPSRVHRAFLPRGLLQIYTVAIVSYQLAQASPLRTWWLVQLLAVLDAWLYLPLVLFICIALYDRRRYTIGLLLLPLVFFAIGYGPRFLPRAVAAAQPIVRIMTWNILYDNAETASIVRTIQAQHPDIIAVQEFSTQDSAILGPQLRTEYPYQALAPTADGVDGMGIFSRYPIQNSLPPALAPTECSCQQVDIVLATTTMTLFNMHPTIPILQLKRIGALPIPTGFSTHLQDPSFQALLDRVANASHSVVVVGDLNTADHLPNYLRLRARLHDAFEAAGWGFGFTYPSSFPLVRLDYILHDAAWTGEAAWIGEDVASDHRYLVADITYRGN